MNEKEKKQEEQPYATELLGMVKSQNKRQFVLISILIFLLAATNLAQAIYHNHQWSQYETIIVDGTSGRDGNTNYIGGENTGGIYNGESESEETKK